MLGLKDPGAIFARADLNFLVRRGFRHSCGFSSLGQDVLASDRCARLVCFVKDGAGLWLTLPTHGKVTLSHVAAAPRVVIPLREELIGRGS